MKCLTIQVQLDRIDHFPEADFLAHVRAGGCYPEIDRSEINTPKFDDHYINFNFFSERLPDYWRKLNTLVYQHPVYGPMLKDTTIVACEGDHGWDDYLTLHHYDTSVTVDTMVQTER